MKTRRITRATRRKQVAELALAGHQRTTIAKRLGVSNATVSRDLTQAEKDAAIQAADLAFQARKERVRRADRIFAEAMDAWERSKQPFKSQRQERALIKAGEKEGVVQSAEGRVTLTQEERVGDARFLAEARGAEVHMSQLLGLYTMPEIGGDSVPVKPGDVLVIRVASNPV